MERWLHSNPGMLLRRIVLLYIVLLLCRIVFYFYNYALIGQIGRAHV